MVILTRSDPEENLERWYAVTVQPTLLNEHAVTCFWGRRDGSYQQQQIFPAETQEEAQKLAKKKIAEKMKRGYKVLGGDDA